MALRFTIPLRRFFYDVGFGAQKKIEQTTIGVIFFLIVTSVSQVTFLFNISFLHFIKYIIPENESLVNNYFSIYVYDIIIEFVTFGHHLRINYDVSN